MSSLLDGIEERDNSLLADLGRTAVSTAATFGAHALKGASLGLLDLTPQVREALGEDIYGAPPSWALSGAELIGEAAPITGALKLGRAIVPGATALPRFLQGAVAGAALGGTRAIIEGEDLGDVLRRSALESLVFGSLEGAIALPETLRRRAEKAARESIAKAVKEIDEVLSPIQAARKEQEFAEKLALNPLRSPVPKTPIGPPPSVAELITRDELRKALSQQASRVGLQKQHRLWGSNVVFQTPKGTFEGQLLGAGGRPGKKGTYLMVKLPDGTMSEINAAPFLKKTDKPLHRMFIGSMEKDIIPANPALDYMQAKKDFKKLTYRLWQRGQLSKDQIRKFIEYANPTAKGLEDLSTHEINRLINLIGKGAKGEMIPEDLYSMVGYFGPEVPTAQLGFLSWFQPARFVVEGISKKMGRKLPEGKVLIPQYPTRIFNRLNEAMTEKKIQKAFLFEKIKGKNGILRGPDGKMFNKDQLRFLYELDQTIRESVQNFKPNSAEYLATRAKIREEWFKKAEEKWGKAAASKLRDAHIRLRQLFNAMFNDVVKAGYLTEKRWRKEYWPLLAAKDTAILKELYPKTPKDINAFFLNIRRDLLNNPETNILKLLDAYIEQYTKLLHVKPAIQEMWRALSPENRRGVPPGLLTWFRHYAAR